MKKKGKFLIIDIEVSVKIPKLGANGTQQHTSEMGKICFPRKIVDNN